MSHYGVYLSPDNVLTIRTTSSMSQYRVHSVTELNNPSCKNSFSCWCFHWEADLFVFKIYSNVYIGTKTHSQHQRNSSPHIIRPSTTIIDNNKPQPGKLRLYASSPGLTSSLFVDDPRRRRREYWQWQERYWRSNCSATAGERGCVMHHPNFGDRTLYLWMPTQPKEGGPNNEDDDIYASAVERGLDSPSSLVQGGWFFANVAVRDSKEHLNLNTVGWVFFDLLNSPMTCDIEALSGRKANQHQQQWLIRSCLRAM